MKVLAVVLAVLAVIVQLPCALVGFTVGVVWDGLYSGFELGSNLDVALEELSERRQQ